jgi:hypothetical protein
MYLMMQQAQVLLYVLQCPLQGKTGVNGANFIQAQALPMVLSGAEQGRVHISPLQLGCSFLEKLAHGRKRAENTMGR